MIPITGDVHLWGFPLCRGTLSHPPSSEAPLRGSTSTAHLLIHPRLRQTMPHLTLPTCKMGTEESVSDGFCERGSALEKFLWC